jgi:hypothetical protein
MNNKDNKSSLSNRRPDIDKESARHNEKIKELIELEKKRIFNAKPIEPKVYGKLKCIHCEQIIQHNLTNCRMCRRIVYCSETCRKTHWSSHKQICALNPQLELLSR